MCTMDSMDNMDYMDRVDGARLGREPWRPSRRGEKSFAPHGLWHAVRRSMMVTTWNSEPESATALVGLSMELNAFDIGVFVAFIGAVVAVSMFRSRRERTSEDYFLAGRGLTWPLIGLSIVAANISTEQFVGMSGQGAGDVGLAVAGYQLLGASRSSWWPCSSCRDSCGPASIRCRSISNTVTTARHAGSWHSTTVLDVRRRARDGGALLRGSDAPDDLQRWT